MMASKIQVKIGQNLEFTMKAILRDDFAKMGDIQFFRAKVGKLL